MMALAKNLILNCKSRNGKGVRKVLLRKLFTTEK